MSKQTNPIENFIIRYNFVIIIVVSAIVLGTSIFLSYLTFIDSATMDESSIQSSIPTSFDPQTSERIEQLHTSEDENIDTKIPSGRINPFSE